MLGTMTDVEILDRALTPWEVRDRYERAVLAAETRPLSALLEQGKEQFAETYPAEQWFDDMVRRAQQLEAGE